MRAKQIIAKQRLGPTFDGQVDADVKAMQSGRKPLSQALHEIAWGYLERDRLYLLEYLESFQRGDEDMSQARSDDEFNFMREPESVPAPPRKLQEPATKNISPRGKTRKSEVKTDDDT